MMVLNQKPVKTLLPLKSFVTQTKNCSAVGTFKIVVHDGAKFDSVIDYQNWREI
jgi:hypothetical protein